MRRAAVCCVLLGCWLVSLPIAPAGASTLPPGFSDSVVASVVGPTDVAFTPDGRLLITTQDGQLRVYAGGALLSAPALDLNAVICSDTERGLLGVAVDPSFASNHYIYLYYTFKNQGSCPIGSAVSPVNRVSRFTLSNSNLVDPLSESVLLDNIPSPNANHNGGDVQFGKDGYLYVTVGDGGCDYDPDSGCGSQNAASRDQNVLLGKVLRITSTGGIPPDNPFQGLNSARCNLTGRTDPGKVCQETYVWGLRNPFRIAFDPNAAGTSFYINDTGQDTWEEIDQGLKRAPTTAGIFAKALVRRTREPIAVHLRPASPTPSTPTSTPPSTTRARAKRSPAVHSCRMGSGRAPTTARTCSATSSAAPSSNSPPTATAPTPGPTSPPASAATTSSPSTSARTTTPKPSTTRSTQTTQSTPSRTRPLFRRLWLRIRRLGIGGWVSRRGRWQRTRRVAVVRARIWVRRAWVRRGLLRVTRRRGSTVRASTGRCRMTRR